MTDGPVSIDTILNRAEAGYWFDIETEDGHEVTAKVTDIPERYDRDDGYDDEVTTFVRLHVPKEEHPVASFDGEATTRIEHFMDNPETPPVFSYGTETTGSYPPADHPETITGFNRRDSNGD
jgi:hypothetical protein